MKTRGNAGFVFMLLGVSSALAAVAMASGSDPNRLDELMLTLQRGNAYQRARPGIVALLDRARQDEPWRYDGASDIPSKALRAIERIFGPELIPVLERIVAENTSVVTFPGAHAPVKFYSLRSLAARVLSEQTGRTCTLVDVDDRTHPGDWNPSMEP
ncbi:MAG: hypothetical protein JSW27_22915 [Phycisphaerales bacterium]|nr:MAG: hypothetical protein JSW27_22915 [Phycisphaerales bacterium]